MYNFQKRAASRVTTGVMGCLILPQKGVVDGTMHFASGASPPTPLRATFTDTQNGNIASNSSPNKRPNALEVTSANAFAAKCIRTDGDDVDEGSLPCSPDIQSDSEMAVLENDTRQLIDRFLMDSTGLSKQRGRESKALSTMKKVVADVLEKHRYAYNGMINKLSLDDRGNDVTFVSAVAKSLFADGTTNWGRIASLVAFGAAVCQSLKEKGRENCVELVGQKISDYLLSEQREWMVKNNSWDGFVEFFRVADPELTVRNTLMAFAGFAGLGATLALWIR